MPKTFTVKRGPKGHPCRTSSSTPANLLHKIPARKGANALARDATPCARPFKTPSVPFDGALFVIWYKQIRKNGRGFTRSMAHVRPRTLANLFNMRTPTNSSHRYTSPVFKPTNGVRKKAIEKVKRPAR